MSDVDSSMQHCRHAYIKKGTVCIILGPDGIKRAFHATVDRPDLTEWDVDKDIPGTRAPRITL
jgi:hypothetical protein